MDVLDIPNNSPDIVPTVEIEAMNPAVVVDDLALAPKASPFAQAADALIAANYTVIPVVPRDKAPGEFRGSIEHGSWAMMTGWNDYAHSKPSDASISRWKTWPDANIGVVLGGDHNGYQLIAIDFDTDDQDELELLAGSIPPSPERKMGSRGFTAFYRGSKDLKTKRYMIAAPTDDKPNAKRTLLEILTGNAPRQTVMPPSMHPHGRPYVYITGNGVVPIARLPVLTQDHLDVLEDNLAHLGWNGDDVVRPDRATRGSPVDDDNIWRETNNIAIENLDMWVGSLGLPKLKRHGNGSWEAIPSFRPSNSGTPLMQRKSNLKFHRSGVKDMGTDDGYTPIDVVVAAFSWDFDSAFHWLRGKLGIKDPDDSFFQLPEPPMTLEETESGDLMDSSTGEVVATAPVASNLVELPAHLTYVPGLLGEMIDFLEKTARRPNRVMSFGSAVTALGTLIGRRDASPTKAGTHLYTLALAPSGSGKDNGLVGALAFLKAAGAAHLIGSGEPMSQTALVKQIQEQELSLSAVDEMGAILNRMNAPTAAAHDSGIKKIMREAWNRSFGLLPTPSWANTPSVLVQSPAFSMYAVSTPAEFYEAVQGGDIVNGMLNRFLILATNKKSKPVTPTADTNDIPQSLTQRLQHAYFVRRDEEFCDAIRNGMTGDDIPDESGRIALVVPWGVGAEAVYTAFSDEIEALGDANPHIAPFFMRTAEMGNRLATIRAVGIDADNPVVSVADIVWGCEIARWSAERMAEDAGDMVSDNPYARLRTKILHKIKEAKDGYVRQTDLMRLGISKTELLKHLDDLQHMGRIRLDKLTSNGKQVPIARPVANDNKPAKSVRKKLA